MREKKNSKKKLSETSKSYLKYSSIGVQMIATILIGVLLGYFLDKKFKTDNIFLAISSLVFVIIAIYYVLKDFIKK